MRVSGEPVGGGGQQHQAPKAPPVSTILNTSNAVLDVGDTCGARETGHALFSAEIASEWTFLSKLC